MALSEQTILAEVTQLPSGEIQSKIVTTVERDGVVISRADHYENYQPGADLTNAPEQVKIIAQATWTPETIKPFTAEVTAAIAEQAAERAKVEEATAALVAAQAELAKAQEAAKAPVDVVA